MPFRTNARRSGAIAALMLCATALAVLAAPAAGAGTLWDQYNLPDNSSSPWYARWINSQDENRNGQADVNGYELFVADDFVVPDPNNNNKTLWRLDSVDVRGLYDKAGASQAGPADSFSVYFYHGGSPADTSGPTVTRLGQSYSNPEPYKFRINLDPPVRLSGTGFWWVGVWARQDKATKGSWSWSRRTSQRQSGAVLYPNFAETCENVGWHRVTDCAYPPTDPDMVFALNGAELDTLVVFKSGSGRAGGSVVSSPPGIDIPTGDGPSGQTTTYPNQTHVMLKARIANGYPTTKFTGWTGCWEPSGYDCDMWMTSPYRSQRVTANFERASGLTFQTDGDGNGAVTSKPAGIDCAPVECRQLRYAKFLLNQWVDFNVEPDFNSVFVGWTGCDYDIGYLCQMKMDDEYHTKHLRATFARAGAINFQKRGRGDGTVTSNPSGVDCPPGFCKANAERSKFKLGTKVTLSATPASGSTFGGWEGCDQPAGRKCTMNVNGERTLRAIFRRPAARGSAALAR